MRATQARTQTILYEFNPQSGLEPRRTYRLINRAIEMMTAMLSHGNECRHGWIRIKRVSICRTAILSRPLLPLPTILPTQFLPQTGIEAPPLCRKFKAAQCC